MKLIEDNLPQQWEEGDGNILITHDGYMYDIGCVGDVFWISRQSKEDYYEGLDNWEKIERWVPENKSTFRFLSKNKLS